MCSLTGVRFDFPFFVVSVTIGIASETLNDWADEEAGLEAVQLVLDSLDDIHALQDPFVEADVMHGMLKDIKLHAMLQVSTNKHTHVQSVRVNINHCRGMHQRLPFLDVTNQNSGESTQENREKQKSTAKDDGEEEKTDLLFYLSVSRFQTAAVRSNQ